MPIPRRPPRQMTWRVGAISLRSSTKTIRHRATNCTSRGAHHRQRHAGIAGGRFDHGIAGLEQALGLGIENDGDREAVLDRAAGIERFDLGVERHISRRDALQAYDRGMADGVENTFMDHWRRPG